MLAINDTKSSHYRWKASSELSDFIEFKRLRATCIKLSRSKYRSYISKVEASLKFNSQSFSSYVNELKKYSHIPSKMFLHSSTAVNEVEITDLFSNHFSSAYSQTGLGFVPRFDSDIACVPDIQLTVESLRNIVYMMNMLIQALMMFLPFL